MSTVLGRPSVIKKANRSVVKEEIRRTPRITKPALAALIGLSLATVNKIVDELEEKHEIISCGYQASTGGRRAKTYRINGRKNSKIVAYVYRGGYISSLLDNENTVLERYEGECAGDEDSLMACIDRHAVQNKLPLEMIGIAVPGTVQNGVIHNIPTIPEWENYNMEAAIRLKYGCKVIVENDIKVATMGVFNAYLSDNIHNIVFVYLNSKGLGAGIVMNDKLYKGRNNFAGEIGSMLTQGDNRPVEDIIEESVKSGNRAQIITIVARVLVNLACTLGPDLFVIATKYLSRPDAEAIKKEIGQHLSMQYIPELIISGVEQEMYTKGLTYICNQTLNRAIQIID